MKGNKSKSRGTKRRQSMIDVDGMPVSETRLAWNKKNQTLESFPFDATIGGADAQNDHIMALHGYDGLYRIPTEEDIPVDSDCPLLPRVVFTSSCKRLQSIRQGVVYSTYLPGPLRLRIIYRTKSKNTFYAYDHQQRVRHEVTKANSVDFHLLRLGDIVRARMYQASDGFRLTGVTKVASPRILHQQPKSDKGITEQQNAVSKDDAISSVCLDQNAPIDISVVPTPPDVEPVVAPSVQPSAPALPAKKTKSAPAQPPSKRLKICPKSRELMFYSAYNSAEPAHWHDALVSNKPSLHLPSAKLYFYELAAISHAYKEGIRDVALAGSCDSARYVHIANIYPQMNFTFYDPDPRFAKTMPHNSFNTKWRNKAFDPEEAFSGCEYVVVDGVKVLNALFISDIRYDNHPVTGSTLDDMKLQKDIVIKYRPRYSLLKFKTLWTNSANNDVYKYLAGQLCFQPFSKRDSNECRLWVRGDDIRHVEYSRYYIEGRCARFNLNRAVLLKDCEHRPALTLFLHFHLYYGLHIDEFCDLDRVTDLGSLLVTWGKHKHIRGWSKDKSYNTNLCHRTLARSFLNGHFYKPGKAFADYVFSRGCLKKRKRLRRPRDHVPTAEDKRKALKLKKRQNKGVSQGPISDQNGSTDSDRPAQVVERTEPRPAPPSPKTDPLPSGCRGSVRHSDGSMSEEEVRVALGPTRTPPLRFDVISFNDINQPLIGQHKEFVDFVFGHTFKANVVHVDEAIPHLEDEDTYSFSQRLRHRLQTYVFRHVTNTTDRSRFTDSQVFVVTSYRKIQVRIHEVERGGIIRRYWQDVKVADNDELLSLGKGIADMLDADECETRTVTALGYVDLTRFVEECAAADDESEVYLERNCFCARTFGKIKLDYVESKEDNAWDWEQLVIPNLKDGTTLTLSQLPRTTPLYLPEVTAEMKMRGVYTANVDHHKGYRYLCDHMGSAMESRVKRNGTIRHRGKLYVCDDEYDSNRADYGDSGNDNVSVQGSDAPSLCGNDEDEKDTELLDAGTTPTGGALNTVDVDAVDAVEEIGSINLSDRVIEDSADGDDEETDRSSDSDNDIIVGVDTPVGEAIIFIHGSPWNDGASNMEEHPRDIAMDDNWATKESRGRHPIGKCEDQSSTELLDNAQSKSTDNKSESVSDDSVVSNNGNAVNGNARALSTITEEVVEPIDVVEVEVSQPSNEAENIGNGLSNGKYTHSRPKSKAHVVPIDQAIRLGHAGRLVLQKADYDKAQFENHVSHRRMFPNHGVHDVFGDNSIDKMRTQGADRKGMGGQAKFMRSDSKEDDNPYFDGHTHPYDVCYGVTTVYSNNNGRRRPITHGVAGPGEIDFNEFRKTIDTQFAILILALQTGDDVVIPVPDKRDYVKYPNRYFAPIRRPGRANKVARANVRHNIGTGIAGLPFAWTSYIQQKIDRLKHSASEVVECNGQYLYDIPDAVDGTGYKPELPTAPPAPSSAEATPAPQRIYSLDSFREIPPCTKDKESMDECNCEHCKHVARIESGCTCRQLLNDECITEENAKVYTDQCEFCEGDNMSVYSDFNGCEAQCHLQPCKLKRFPKTDYNALPYSKAPEQDWVYIDHDRKGASFQMPRIEDLSAKQRRDVCFIDVNIKLEHYKQCRALTNSNLCYDSFVKDAEYVQHVGLRAERAVLRNQHAKIASSIKPGGCLVCIGANPERMKALGEQHGIEIVSLRPTLLPDDYLRSAYFQNMEHKRWESACKCELKKFISGSCKFRSRADFVSLIHVEYYLSNNELASLVRTGLPILSAAHKFYPSADGFANGFYRINKDAKPFNRDPLRRTAMKTHMRDCADFGSTRANPLAMWESTYRFCDEDCLEVHDEDEGPCRGRYLICSVEGQQMTYNHRHRAERNDDLLVDGDQELFRSVLSNNDSVYNYIYSSKMDARCTQWHSNAKNRAWLKDKDIKAAQNRDNAIFLEVFIPTLYERISKKSNWNDKITILKAISMGWRQAEHASTKVDPDWTLSAMKFRCDDEQVYIGGYKREKAPLGFEPTNVHTSPIIYETLLKYHHEYTYKVSRVHTTNYLAMKQANKKMQEEGGRTVAQVIGQWFENRRTYGGKFIKRGRFGREAFANDITMQRWKQAGWNSSVNAVKTLAKKAACAASTLVGGLRGKTRSIDTSNPLEITAINLDMSSKCVMDDPDAFAEPMDPRFEIKGPIPYSRNNKCASGFLNSESMKKNVTHMRNFLPTTPTMKGRVPGKCPFCTVHTLANRVMYDIRVKARINEDWRYNAGLNAFAMRYAKTLVGRYPDIPLDRFTYLETRKKRHVRDALAQVHANGDHMLDVTNIMKGVTTKVALKVERIIKETKAARAISEGEIDLLYATGHLWASVGKYCADYWDYRSTSEYESIYNWEINNPISTDVPPKPTSDKYHTSADYVRPEPFSHVFYAGYKDSMEVGGWMEWAIKRCREKMRLKGDTGNVVVMAADYTGFDSTIKERLQSLGLTMSTYAALQTEIHRMWNYADTRQFGHCSGLRFDAGVQTKSGHPPTGPINSLINGIVIMYGAARASGLAPDDPDFNCYAAVFGDDNNIVMPESDYKRFKAWDEIEKSGIISRGSAVRVNEDSPFHEQIIHIDLCQRHYFPCHDKYGNPATCLGGDPAKFFTQTAMCKLPLTASQQLAYAYAVAEQATLQYPAHPIMSGYLTNIMSLAIRGRDEAIDAGYLEDLKAKAQYKINARLDNYPKAYARTYEYYRFRYHHSVEEQSDLAHQLASLNVLRCVISSEPFNRMIAFGRQITFNRARDEAQRNWLVEAGVDNTVLSKHSSPFDEDYEAYFHQLFDYMLIKDDEIDPDGSIKASCPGYELIPGTDKKCVIPQLGAFYMRHNSDSRMPPAFKRTVRPHALDLLCMLSQICNGYDGWEHISYVCDRLFKLPPLGKRMRFKDYLNRIPESKKDFGKSGKFSKALPTVRITREVLERTVHYIDGRNTKHYDTHRDTSRIACDDKCILWTSNKENVNNGLVKSPGRESLGLSILPTLESYYSLTEQDQIRARGFVTQFLLEDRDIDHDGQTAYGFVPSHDLNEFLGAVNRCRKSLSGSVLAFDDRGYNLLHGRLQLLAHRRSNTVKLGALSTLPP